MKNQKLLIAKELEQTKKYFANPKRLTDGEYRLPTANHRVLIIKNGYAVGVYDNKKYCYHRVSQVLTKERRDTLIKNALIIGVNEQTPAWAKGGI